MDSQGTQRPGLMTFTQKPHRDSLNCFLGYHATGQKGLEGADRRLKHPASRYLKIKHLRNFRKCFFDAREHRVNTKSFYFI